MCDSCFDEYGPKDSQPGSSQGSPVKKKSSSSAASGHGMEGGSSDLPAEYLNSPLSQQVRGTKKKAAFLSSLLLRL